MFGQPKYSSARSANVREIDRRLRSIEHGLERASTRAASSAVGTADQVTESVASVLASLADRFRGLSMGDEAAKFRGDAAKFGNDTQGLLKAVLTTDGYRILAMNRRVAEELQITERYAESFATIPIRKHGKKPSRPCWPLARNSRSTVVIRQVLQRKLK